MPVHRLAAGVAVQFPLQRFLELLRRLFFGLLQRLPFGLGLQAQPLGPRLGALLLALLFASVAFAADRLQIRLEVIGAVIVVDLLARLDVLDGAYYHLALAGLTSDSAFGLQA